MRINEKINEIEKYLDELESIIPKTFDEYEDIKEKAACERYFEKIIEAVIDLCFLIVKEKNLEKPEDDKGVFDILLNSEVISKGSCENLKNAKGMENIISHQYGSIDNKIVFHSITEELVDDVNKFLDGIKKI